MLRLIPLLMNGVMANSDEQSGQWGGARPGAGRKGKWRSPTKLMRLPEQFEQEIMAYAELLDAGKTVTLVIEEEQSPEDIE